MTYLMPDPEEARFLGLTTSYADWRVWWMQNVVGLPVPKRRTSGRFKPIPGVIDAADEEA